MPRVLILYGTTYGHTAKIAAAISNALNDMGIDTDVIQAGTVDPSVPPYDGVIVAGSIRAGNFPRALIACVRRHADAINAKPNAFVPVCLAVLQRDNPKVTAELDAIVRRFSARCGWKPAQVRFVPGALRYTHYNVFTRWVMKRIAAKAGGDTDTIRDYVYTNWSEVKAFAIDFGRGLKTTPA